MRLRIFLSEKKVMEFIRFRAWRERLFDFLERHSRSGPEPMQLTPRIVLGGATVLAVVLVAYGLVRITDPGSYLDPHGVQLNGDWDFRNGEGAEVRKVSVPKPLPLDVQKNLAPTYFYSLKKDVSSVSALAKKGLSLSLGSIKGDYSIWIDGKHLASGEGNTLAQHSVPADWIEGKRYLTIRIAVNRMDHPYPGIVHATPMQIGRTAILKNQVRDYYFQYVVKPIIPALFKLSLFLLFAAFFIFMPHRREYAAFAIYCVFSACSDFSQWRYSPVFENSYLRYALIFIFGSFSWAMVPVFTSEFLRFNRTLRAYAYGFSLFIASVSVLSIVWIHRDKLPGYLHSAQSILPAIFYSASFILAVSSALFLRFKVKVFHRFLQVALVSGVLLLSLALHVAFFWVPSFGAFRYQEFMNVMVLACLAGLLAADFKNLDILYKRSNKALPSRVNKMINAGILSGITEFVAVTLLVDVVGYTKKLISLTAAERDHYNSKIKSLLTPLVQSCGGEKVSDTGDGAVYVWELQSSLDLRASAELALRAAEKITALHRQHPELGFRVGISYGTVRCHLNGGDYSFLGDPLNVAARLEASAESNQVLVDEFLVQDAGLVNLCGEEKSVNIKGADFLARPLKKSA